MRSFVALLEHPSSPVRQVIPDPTLRRVLTGIAMGLTAIAIVYSPWGKQSGAHFNPSVTLTFWRLGKVATGMPFFYVVAQFAGADGRRPDRRGSCWASCIASSRGQLRCDASRRIRIRRRAFSPRR